MQERTNLSLRVAIVSSLPIPSLSVATIARTAREVEDKLAPNGVTSIDQGAPPATHTAHGGNVADSGEARKNEEQDLVRQGGMVDAARGMARGQ